MNPSLFKDCKEQLGAIAESSGKTRNFSELLEYAQLIADVHGWCTASLSNIHLVEVACALKEQFDVSVEQMGLLGVPVDLLEYFPNWEYADCLDFKPPESRVVLPEVGASCGIGLLRLQLSPFSLTLSAALLLIKRLMEVFDDSIKYSIAVEPGGDFEALHQIISDFGSNAKERVSLIELQSSSIFAQDNARGARLQTGEPLMIIPRGFRKERERELEALNSKIDTGCFDLPIVRSKLFWEGGNIVSDDSCCFIGVDHLRENMTRLGLTREQVVALFHSEFGENIEFLGSFQDTNYSPGEIRPFSTGQASFHIDLDLHVLGKIGKGEAPVALLATPEMGLKLLEPVLSDRRLVSDHFMSEQEAREHIEFEYRYYAEERSEHLKLYRETLNSRGYYVVDVPDLRIDPQDNLFSTRNLNFIYCNVLSAELRGDPTIFYLPYDIPLLDELARQAYKKTGCKVVEVARTGRLANLLMLFNGGLRCACSQIY